MTDNMEKFGNAMPKWTGGVNELLYYKERFTLDATVLMAVLVGHVNANGVWNWMISRGLN